MDPLQNQAPYLEAAQRFLARHQAAGRFIVPGHQGHCIDKQLQTLLQDIWAIDLPQHTYGLDKDADVNPLLQAQALAATLYGAQATHFLAAGASQANQAAMVTVCRGNDKIAVQRNSHLSIEQGLIATGAKAVYVEPCFDTKLMAPETVNAQQLQQAFAKDPDISAVFVVSPTYFGHTADIAALAQVCHRHNAYLIVDQAWGAHFGFHPDVPQSATTLGADLTIMSSHKTIGALTSGAMLHVGNKSLIYRAEKAVGALSTTSPSLPILLSLDGCRRNLAVNGHAQLQQTIETRKAFSAMIANSDLTVIEGDDPLKLIVDTKGDANAYAKQLARLHNLHVEMAYGSCVLLLLGLNQTKENLCLAAKQMLATPIQPKTQSTAPTLPKHFPEAKYTARQTFYHNHVPVPLEHALGRVSAETIAAYPPGIPVVVAGQTLDSDIIEYLLQLRQSQTTVYGASDHSLQTIHVIDEEDKA